MKSSLYIEPLVVTTARVLLRHSFTVLACTLLVVACGGGGDNGTDSGGTTPTSFALGGSVAGLAGSGLTLNNGAVSQTISGNGGFTFPGTLADGAGYAVSVTSQPANPRQTCVVSSGSGNISGANVSDVAVACMTDVASIVVTPATMTFDIGATATLQAQALDSNGAPITATVTWSSLDSTIAAVSASGVVTGVAQGATSITATVGTVQGNAALSVTATVVNTGTQTGADLIDAAQQSGAISAEVALEYKVFATFNDSRLPPQFKGNDSALFESGAIELVYQSWSTLSDAAKTTLEPFQVPPA